MKKIAIASLIIALLSIVVLLYMKTTICNKCSPAGKDAPIYLREKFMRSIIEFLAKEKHLKFDEDNLGLAESGESLKVGIKNAIAKIGNPFNQDYDFGYTTDLGYFICEVPSYLTERLVIAEANNKKISFLILFRERNDHKIKINQIEDYFNKLKK